jgi:hypothetical protein
VREELVGRDRESAGPDGRPSQGEEGKDDAESPSDPAPRPSLRTRSLLPRSILNLSLVAGNPQRAKTRPTTHSPCGRCGKDEDLRPPLGGRGAKLLGTRRAHKAPSRKVREKVSTAIRERFGGGGRAAAPERRDLSSASLRLCPSRTKPTCSSCSSTEPSTALISSSWRRCTRRKGPRAARRVCCGDRSRCRGDRPCSTGAIDARHRSREGCLGGCEGSDARHAPRGSGDHRSRLPGVSAEQTERGLPEHKKIALECVLGQERGVRVPLVYVGASLRDFDVVLVLQASPFAVRSEEMWVGPLRELSIDTFAQSRYDEWRRGGRDELELRFISTSADEFCSLLAGEVAAL